jgi:hypothetical protein
VRSAAPTQCNPRSSSPASSNGARVYHHPATHSERGFSFDRLSVTSTGVHNGDWNEKWIKETRLDTRPSSRAEDNGPQENPRRPNCQEVKTDRRGNAAEGIQHGIVARLTLTNRIVELSQLRSPASRGAFQFSPITGICSLYRRVRMNASGLYGLPTHVPENFFLQIHAPSAQWSLHHRSNLHRPIVRG